MVQNSLKLSSVFQECQRKLEHKLGLDSYLLKPVQRLTKYQLLLKVFHVLLSKGITRWIRFVLFFN